MKLILSLGFLKGDHPKLVLVGEPGSGWRAAFDIIPGMRVMVGRPNHASRNMATVAYLPSRAVSRMHAVITMEEDGVRARFPFADWDRNDWRLTPLGVERRYISPIPRLPTSPGVLWTQYGPRCVLGIVQN